MKKVFVSLLILRFLLTLLPQTGYIHPDEFFQSMEIIAGDMLDLEVLRTWEFNCSSPIRSMVPPYATAGLAVAILKASSMVSPYTLVMVPRLIMAALSVSTDIFLYRICKLLSSAADPYVVMSVHASSYVVLAFLPRTMSNSLEYILFSAVIFLVIKHVKTFPKSSLTSNSRFLAFVSAVGVFNRPTFAIFAIVPGCTWLYGFKHRWAEFPSHFLNFAVTFLVTAFALVSLDSLYYGGDAANSPVVTPLNFLIYNSDASKLDLHGLHPRFTHILVNVPMLFGVLGILGYGLDLRWFLERMVRKVEDVNSPVKPFLIFSFTVPIITLSVVPHQEARFLIPVLFPLVLLTSHQLTGHGKFYRISLCLWLLGNVAGLSFYGFLHQGGLIPALFHVSKLETGSELIFYRTYMPPRHILLDDRLSPKFKIHDLMGGPLETLKSTVDEINATAPRNGKILLVSPTSIRRKIHLVLRNRTLRLVKRFVSHVSMEDLPWDISRDMGLDIHELF